MDKNNRNESMLLALDIIWVIWLKNVKTRSPPQKIDKDWTKEIDTSLKT